MNEPLKLLRPSITVSTTAMQDPKNYLVTDPDLITAADTAMTLGRPLLLTGEPGIGKSVFSRWVALQLDYHWLSHSVKSTTEARELFYQYDYLRHFHATKPARALQTDAPNDDVTLSPLRFLTYNALGKSVLFSMGTKKAQEKGFISPDMGKQYIEFQHNAELPKPSVVLIDEIDKAPRDVPNDILVEIEEMSFHVPELENYNQQARAELEYRPLIIITSNSERDLPEPFLRRCLYYHMHLPDNEAIMRILTQRLGDRYKNSKIVSEALHVFRVLREDLDDSLRPRLSELLDWLYLLSTIDQENPRALVTHEKLIDHPRWFTTMLTTMIKDPNEQRELAENYPDLASRERWLNQLPD